MNFDNYNAGFDQPDPRDVPAHKILDMAGAIPSSVILDNTAVLNQGGSSACTVFGSSGALFETSFLDARGNGTSYNQPYDPWKVWDKAKERGASDTQGWSIQGAVQLIRDLGYSAGYAIVAGSGNSNPTPLKQALSNGYALVTGSQYGDWGKISQTGIYSEKSTPSGHIYQFNGYDDNHLFPSGEKGGFHSPNSWGGECMFWIPYSMIGSLYSTYIQLDPSDIDAMRDYRNVQAKLYAEKAKQRAVWNGERPDDIASNEEIAIMLGRTLYIIGLRPRIYWATVFTDVILRGKGLLPIYNEKQAQRNATTEEVAIMFTRAVKRDQKASSGVLTRWQVACVIGRDFLT